MGGVHRIYRLCSDDRDIWKHLINFKNRLMARGYTKSTIIPLFNSAIHKQKALKLNRDITIDGSMETERKMMFHISHHPLNPPNRTIQRLYEEIMKPHQVPDLCVCVHRTCNLRNALTYRRMDRRPGPPTSSYFTVPVEIERPPVVRENTLPHTPPHTHLHTHTHTHSRTSNAVNNSDIRSFLRPIVRTASRPTAATYHIPLDTCDNNDFTDNSNNNAWL